MAYRDRSECVKKWFATNYTDINPDTGEMETHTLERWMLIKVPGAREYRKKYYGF